MCARSIRLGGLPVKFSVLPAVRATGSFWRYGAPRQCARGAAERRSLQAAVGHAVHRRRRGPDVLQLSVDGHTGEMGQTGSDGMEGAILPPESQPLGPEV